MCVREREKKRDTEKRKREGEKEREIIHICASFCRKKTEWAAVGSRFLTQPTHTQTQQQAEAYVFAHAN